VFCHVFVSMCIYVVHMCVYACVCARVSQCSCVPVSEQKGPPSPLPPPLSSSLGLDDKDKDKNGWAVGDGLKIYFVTVFESALCHPCPRLREASPPGCRQMDPNQGLAAPR